MKKTKKKKISKVRLSKIIKEIKIPVIKKKRKVKPKTKKNPLGSGRDKKVLDVKVFKELCAIQCTEKEVCSVLDMNIDTLLRNLKEIYGLTFAEIRSRYADFGRASLRRIQISLAKTSPAMAIWLGKQYLGQREPREAPDGSLDITPNNLGNLRDEELDAIIERNFEKK